MKTFWKNLQSGAVYIYYNGQKPYNSHLWTEVSENDYIKALTQVRA